MRWYDFDLKQRNEDKPHRIEDIETFLAEGLRLILQNIFVSDYIVVHQIRRISDGKRAKLHFSHFYNERAL